MVLTPGKQTIFVKMILTPFLFDCQSKTGSLMWGKIIKMKTKQFCKAIHCGISRTINYI